MRIALIAPITNLELSERGDMFMALTHLVLKNKKYCAFFQKQTKYKLLDNSAYELQLNNIENVVEAAEMIKANEIILPDVLCDAEATMNATDEALDWLEKKGLIGRYKLMAVAQGRDKDSWWHCFDYFNARPEINVIGLSKVSCPKAFNKEIVDARTEITHAIEQTGNINPKKEYHLLGGSRHILQEAVSHPPFIRSIDSSAPFAYGQRRMLLNKNLSSDVKFQIERSIPASVMSYVELNVNLLMERSS